jgi:MYXO-CTERM domain-containing protein
VDYREPKPEPTSPEPVTPTEKPSVTGEPTVNGDAGVTDTGAPTPPSSGCNGCSTGSHTPSNAPLGWLLLLLLPLGFKRRQKRS